MNETYMRNNIYFFYLKENVESINIGYFIDNIFYDFNGNIIGKKYELFNDTSLVIAPIDILLYHIPNLEYLNRRYSEEEKIKLKNHDMSAINSKMIKYFYNAEEIVNLKKEIIKIPKDTILNIIRCYQNYLKHQQEEPVLKIYTSFSIR